MTRTWTEPRWDFRLCRWPNRSPGRTCWRPPPAGGSPSASYRLDGPGTGAAAGRSAGRTVEPGVLLNCTAFTLLLMDYLEKHLELSSDTQINLSAFTA